MTSFNGFPFIRLMLDGDRTFLVSKCFLRGFMIYIFSTTYELET
jgi:hypothetical protein